MRKQKSSRWSWKPIVGLAVIALVATAGTTLIKDSHALTGDCGSGYSTVSTNTLRDSSGNTGPAQVILYKSSTKYCAVTNHTGSAQNVYATTRAQVKNGAGTVSNDQGNYRYYAGPVYVNITNGCTQLYGSMVWNSKTYTYNHTGWCINPPAPPPPPPAPAPAPTPKPPPAPTPAPAPAPSPTPKPSPSPTPSPTPRPSSPAPRPGSSSPAPTPSPAPFPASGPLSAESNAAVTAGTLASRFTVPAGGANVVRIKYGTSPILLDITSEDAVPTGNEAIVTLKNLNASTTYSYVIERTNDTGQIVASPVGTFKTADYTVAMHFINNKSNGIKDIPAEIASLKKKGKSDRDGIVKFDGVPHGGYTVSFTYKKKTTKQQISVNSSGVSSEKADDPNPATVNFFVNLDKLSTVSSSNQPSDSTSIWPWLGAAVGLAIVGFFVIRRIRRGKNDDFGLASEYDDLQPAVPPEYQAYDAHDQPVGPSEGGPITGDGGVDLPMADQGNSPKHAPPFMPEEMPEHMGESLKEMVLRGMPRNGSGQHTSQIPPQSQMPNMTNMTNVPQYPQYPGQNPSAPPPYPPQTPPPYPPAPQAGPGAGAAQQPGAQPEHPKHKKDDTGPMQIPH